MFSHRNVPSNVAVIVIAILWGGVFLFSATNASQPLAAPEPMALSSATLRARAVVDRPAAAARVETADSSLAPNDAPPSTLLEESTSESLPVADVASQPEPTLVPTLPPLGPSQPTVGAVPVEVKAIPAAPVAGQVVIQFAPGSSQAERAAYVAQIGGSVVQQIPALDTVVVQVSNATTPAELPESPVVAARERDYVVVALDAPAPDDPLYSEQWALTAMQAPDAWAALPEERDSVTVAVIDSGICATHPDLAGRILPGFDFVEGDASPEDAYGHGCAIAGIIAANSNDGIGMAGLASNARIMPLRVLDADGLGTYSDVAAAIVYAADQGAAVINLSLGGVSASDTLQAAIDYAIDKDVVVIAAAGNTGVESVLYPAAYAPVIAVAAVDQTLQRASYSSFGAEVDLYAPGSGIVVTGLDGAWTNLSGTSFAAAFVSAVAALRIAQDVDLVMDGGVVSALPGESLALVEAPQPAASPVADAPLPAEYEPILQRIEEGGSARVIVGLAGDFRPENELTPQGVESQRMTIQAAQTSLVSALQAYDVSAITRFETIPYLSVVIDEAALRFLARSSQVSNIQLERYYRPDLSESTGIIGANTAWASGYTGAGYTVAVVDTGVDITHPFLSGKINNAVCFSYNGADVNGSYTSLCPNGQMTQTGPDAGVACGLNGCDHGTHVAGIAIGDGVTFDGVAPGASLLPVQVYTRVSSLAICNSLTPCIVAFDTEILLGLEWIYNQRTTYQVASVNMSLGSSDHIATDCTDMHSPMASMVTQLQAANIATIAASGNYGGNTGVAFPGCIDPVVNVAATDKTDAVVSFSQLGPNLDFGAPGFNINSSVPGGGFGVKSGTSMAAPHVAGAWALARQARPTASFQQIYDAFANTSVLLTRASDGGTVRRINVSDAIAALSSDATPIPATNTPLPPTSTPLPPTQTPVLPTSTALPPTATPIVGEPTFYRAINLGGPALVIDGHNWDAQTAANYTTNGSPACNPWTPLVPTTDTARTSMIQCSVQHWAHAISLSSVPAGTYDVYAYTWLDWSDPNAQPFNIQLEGAPVQGSVSLTTGGQWLKLGPWRVAVNDGALNLTTTGGLPNLSGVEVWRVDTVPPTSTPTATFTHTPIPPTPTLTPTNMPTNTPIPPSATPVPPTSTPIPQSAPSATPVPPTNTPVPPSATPLPPTNTPVLPSATPLPPTSTSIPPTPTLTPTNTPVPTLPPFPTPTPIPASSTPVPTLPLLPSPTPVVTVPTFYRAINLGGDAVVVDGNSWDGKTATGYTTNGNAACNPWMPLTPSTDTARTTMIRCSVQHWAHAITLSSVPAGTYDVYAYTWLDWTDPNAQAFNVRLEGQLVESGVLVTTGGQWLKLGPWRVTVSDGALNLTTESGLPNLSGVEVWRVDAVDPTSTPLPPTTAPALPQPTSTSADAASTPVPTLPPFSSPTPLPPTNTPVPTLPPLPSPTPIVPTSTPLPPTPVIILPTFYRGINLGGDAMVVDGNSWDGKTAANYTTNGNGVCNPWMPLTPATDTAHTTMIQCSVQYWAHAITMTNVPAGSYDVYIYTWLDWADPNAGAFDVLLEGQHAQDDVLVNTAGQWLKLGPYRVTVSDGALNLTTEGGLPNLSGIEVWRVNG